MLPDGVMIALITVGVPALSAAIAVLFRQRQMAAVAAKEALETSLEVARQSGREEARAEAYRQKSTLLITQQAEEARALIAQLEEVRKCIAQLEQEKIPHLTSELSIKDATIHRLSESFEVLSNTIKGMLVPKEIES